MRVQRTWQVPSRFAYYNLLPNSVVINEGKVIYFDLLVDVEIIIYYEATKRKLWKEAMLKELKSIENSYTWAWLLYLKGRNKFM